MASVPGCCRPGLAADGRIQQISLQPVDIGSRQLDELSAPDFSRAWLRPVAFAHGGRLVLADPAMAATDATLAATAAARRVRAGRALVRRRRARSVGACWPDANALVAAQRTQLPAQASSTGDASAVGHAGARCVGPHSRH
jgi:hypothetical protein